jgi:copper(I)-binding protein
MSIKRWVMAALVCLGLWSSAQAQVKVERAWARTTVAGQGSSGAFMRITALSDVRLTGASSPVAGMVEVHEMKIDDGIMRMRPAGELALKAGQSIELKSGGYHLMLMDLKRQIKAGETVPLTLKFKAPDGSVSEVAVKAVAALTQPAP